MSDGIINVVATCTKRKSIEVPKALRLGSIRLPDGKRRAIAWRERLESSLASHCTACELYSGDQWQVVRSLQDVGSRLDLRVNLWVCSAGYGLISAEAPLLPYSATFSANHPDSVSRAGLSRSTIHSEWWQLLSSWNGPSPKDPRSLEDLARRNPNVPLLVIASPVYLTAMHDDLAGARTKLSSPELLAIVSAGSGEIGILTDHRIPCDSRLQHAFGGALMSLNARIARRVVERVAREGWNRRALTSYFCRLLSRQPEQKAFCRKTLSDERVRAFVRRHSTKHANASASGLLRILRDSGYACEQKRFGKLFNEVKETSNGR